MPFGALLDRHPLQYFVFAEFLQARGEDIAGYSQVALEFFESADTKKGFTYD